jgi:hypothetical protein
MNQLESHAGIDIAIGLAVAIAAAGILFAFVPRPMNAHVYSPDRGQSQERLSAVSMRT